MPHIKEIIDEVLPSLINSTKAHANSEVSTDEAHAKEAGLSVEEWRKIMDKSCEHQKWLDNMREAHETESDCGEDADDQHLRELQEQGLNGYDKIESEVQQ